MELGNKEEVSFYKEGAEQCYFIEANPQFKSVTIYDEHSKKVTLAAALGSKTIESEKTASKINAENDNKNKIRRLHIT